MRHIWRALIYWFTQLSRRHGNRHRNNLSRHFDDNSMANFYCNMVVTHVISIGSWNLRDESVVTNDERVLNWRGFVVIFPWWKCQDFCRQVTINLYSLPASATGRRLRRRLNLPRLALRRFNHITPHRCATAKEYINLSSSNCLSNGRLGPQRHTGKGIV